MNRATALYLTQNMGTIQLEASANADCDQQTYTFSYKNLDSPNSDFNEFSKSYNQNGTSRVLTIPVSLFDYSEYEIRVTFNLQLSIC